jgi:23S rRNA pseudouridine1911/1915/1917 synthase
MPDGATATGPRTLRVPDGKASRVDRVVADATGLSRSYVQKLISDGRLTADGLALKSNAIVQPGSELRLDVPPVVTPEIAPAPEIPVHVVYEDDDLLIVDKPSGLVVHPSPGHAADTLVNALLARADGSEYGGIAGVARPGIVHRLDRDTSGLLMVAKGDAAQASLMAQLKARRIKKTYLALVRGSVSAAAGRIEAPIGRDPKHRTRMAVVTDGRPSVTGYRVRERFEGWTLLELDLVTGRTHQIRVHLDAIGHPVAATRSTAARSHGADRMAWVGCSCTPGGSSWRRHPTGISSGRRRRSPTSWRGCWSRSAPRRGRAVDGRPHVLDRARADGAGRGRTRRPAGDHLGPERGGEGHDHRRPARAAARPGLPLRRDLHDPGAAARRGGRHQLPLPRP